METGFTGGDSSLANYNEGQKQHYCDNPKDCKPTKQVEARVDPMVLALVYGRDFQDLAYVITQDIRGLQARHPLEIALGVLRALGLELPQNSQRKDQARRQITSP